MIKRWKQYQQWIVASFLVAVLTLVMSLFSVCMHYFYLRSTYQSIVAEEQNKVLSEIESLTIKDAIEKGYGPQIQLLLKPRVQNTSPMERVDQLRRIEIYAWVSGLAAIAVIIILLFLYWYIRQRIIKSIHKDLNGVLTQVNQIVNAVDWKDKRDLLNMIPVILEGFGYQTLAQWIRKAVVTEESTNNNF
jgi:cbb3-type cytochrome oxidase subunit 3